MRSLIATASVLAALALPACSSPSPAPKPHPSRTAAVDAAAASRACGKLSASPVPLAAYDQLVLAEVSRLAGGGDASPAQERQARATVAREVAAACPQFKHLAKEDG